MPNRYTMVGRIVTTLSTGDPCRAFYSLRDDGRLLIRCAHVYAPAIRLSPGCDRQVVELVARAAVGAALARAGLFLAAN